jgi:hypothetical protein
MKTRSFLDFNSFCYYNLVVLTIVVINHPTTIYFRFDLNIYFFLNRLILVAAIIIFMNTQDYLLALFQFVMYYCFFNHYFLFFHLMLVLNLYFSLMIIFLFIMLDYFDFDYLYSQLRKFHFVLHFIYHFWCFKNYYYFDYSFDFLDLLGYDTHYYL